MFIIWRGWGLIVPLIAAVAFFGAAIVTASTRLQPPLSGITFAAAEILGGIVIWLIASRIENETGPTYVEKLSGREITIQRSAGSLFFVPTRYWAFVLAAFGLFLLFVPFGKV